MIGYRYQLVHWSHYGLTPVLLDGVKPCGLVNQLGYCNYMRFEENCSFIMIGYQYRLILWSHYGLTPVLLGGVNPCGLMFS